MKIKQLDIAGFRSLKNVSWQPGDLNVVIGPNGTGKSNLLRVLDIISALAQGGLSKHIQASGGMGALVWDGVASSISVRLEFCDPNFDYDLELVRLGASSTYIIQNETLIGNQPDNGEKSVVRYFENGKAQLAEEELLGIHGYVPQQESLLGHPSMPSNLIPNPIRLRRRLSGITIYHTLNVNDGSQIRQAVIARSEKKIEADGQNLVQVLHTLYTGDREFEHRIDAAMLAAFGGDYEKLIFTPDAGDQRVQMKVRWRSLQRAQSTADLSDGTLRFLLLMAILAAPDPPMLIAIDEPETGLHPSMFPIIAEYAVEASSRTQVVFTTHSPQFLDAFTDVKPTTTVAKWEEGETSLHVLAGDELKYWLSEYSLGSLFTSGELEAMA